jgi:FkbM family methyltransferase
MDVWSIKETFLDDFYRLSYFDRRRSGVIIDVGAGIGEFAIQAAAFCPDCKIFGFEPFPESFNYFEQNIKLNNLKNIVAVDAAATSIPGNLVMDISSGNPLQYQMRGGASESQSLSVKSIGLIEFMDTQAIKTCHFLKLDCEGGEFDILLPLHHHDLARFETIVMEFHDTLTRHTHHEIVEKLSAAGFRVEVVPNQVHADLGYIYAQAN